MSIDLNRITNPLRIAAGSHKKGSGKGCAMNAISYINGDIQITDYPECSAKPLARIVQLLNDSLAPLGRLVKFDVHGLASFEKNPDGDYLSPVDAATVLDLGWRTVGTGGASDSVVRAWMQWMAPGWLANQESVYVGSRLAGQELETAAILLTGDLFHCAGLSRERRVKTVAEAIDVWRELMGLDEAPAVDHVVVDSALDAMARVAA